MGTPLTSTYTAWFRPTLVTGPAETEYPAGKVCWLHVDVSGGQEEASDGAAAVATPPRADANTKRLREADSERERQTRIRRAPAQPHGDPPAAISLVRNTAAVAAACPEEQWHPDEEDREEAGPRRDLHRRRS